VVCGDIWPCQHATAATRAGLDQGFTDIPLDEARLRIMSDDDLNLWGESMRNITLEECAVIASQHACGDLANIFRRMKVRA